MKLLSLSVLLVSLTLPLAARAADSPAPPASPPEETAREEALPREVVEKLSPVQLVEVLKKREEAKIHLASVKHGNSGKPEDVLVPLGFFACVLALVGLPLYFRHRKDREQQGTLRLMLEKGVSIPVEFLAPPARKHGDLRRGVLLVAAGLGVAVFLRAVQAPAGAWTLGLVPFLIGVAHLVVWRLVSRTEASASPPRAD
jgi:hypothetical protein